MSKQAKIMMVIGLVVIVGGIWLLAKTPQQQQAGKAIDSKSLVRSTSHMTGSPNAKVTLVEFGDFQCPACGAAYPVLKPILATYQSNPNFNFVFRNFPLPQHPYAQIAAEASEAAGAQGKYWQMHDM